MQPQSLLFAFIILLGSFFFAACSSINNLTPFDEEQAAAWVKANGMKPFPKQPNATRNLKKQP